MISVVSFYNVQWLMISMTLSDQKKIEDAYVIVIPSFVRLYMR